MKKKVKKPEENAVKKNTGFANKNAFYFILLFVFAFILYGNTIPNDYSLDDNLVVYQHPVVGKGFEAIQEIFTSHYRQEDNNEYGYRPIAMVTFAVENEFFGRDPHISHFINIILYALLLILLLKLLNSLFPEIPNGIRFLMVLLFAAHPLHTEVVASLKNREEMLSFLFAMLAALLFIEAVVKRKYRIVLILLGVLSLSLSVLSKQSGLIFCVMIPLILLQFYYKPIDLKNFFNPATRSLSGSIISGFALSFLLGLICVYTSFFYKVTGILFFIVIPVLLLYYYFKKAGNNKFFKAGAAKQLYGYSFLIILSILIIAIGYFLYKIPEIALPAEEKPLFGFENPLFVNDTLYNRVSLGFMSLWFYFKLMFIPYPLCFYYGYNMVPLTGLGDIRVVFSAIIHIALFITGVYLFYKNKVISFGILFYQFGLLLFSNMFVIIPGIIGERLLFISSFGFSVALTYLIYRVAQKGENKNKNKNHIAIRATYFFSIVVLLIYSSITISRNTSWKDHLSLYKADIEYLGNSAKANCMIADELMRKVYLVSSENTNSAAVKTDVEKALKYYKRAIEIYPEYASVYNNIGTIYFNFKKDYSNAIPYLKKAIYYDSTYKQAYYNLALSHRVLENMDSSLYYYTYAYKYDSSNVLLISDYANLENELGDFNKAVKLNERIILLDTASDLPYINIGNYLLKRGDTTGAVESWETALQRVPTNRNLCYNLYMYFYTKGEVKKAAYYQEKLQQIDAATGKRIQ